MLEIDLFDDLDENYYPSESTMIDFFFGKYLHELSEEKGYPLWHTSDNKLRQLIIQGDKSFKHGNLINWEFSH